MGDGLLLRHQGKLLTSVFLVDCQSIYSFQLALIDHYSEINELNSEFTVIFSTDP